MKKKITISKIFEDFRLLLFRNFLLRKREWKVAFLAEVLVPLFLMSNCWEFKNIRTDVPKIIIIETNLKMRVEQYLKTSMKYLYVVPDNTFTEIFMNDVQICLGLKKNGPSVYIKIFFARVNFKNILNFQQ